MAVLFRRTRGLEEVQTHYCPCLLYTSTMEECIELAKEVAEEFGKLDIPVYLYEEAATKPERKNLADIRKGQYEGFFEKISGENWKPDFGPQVMNIKSGCSAIGARVPLVAFNVNLGTNDVEIAKAIAKKVRRCV